MNVAAHQLWRRDEQWDALVWRRDEQWDALVRVAASLKGRTSPARVVLKRLAASSDRLANALRALGRLLKTTHVLRYLHDAQLRGPPCEGPQPGRP